MRFSPPTKRQPRSRRSTADQAALLQALQEVEFAEPHRSADDREGHVVAERNGGEGHEMSEEEGRNGGEGHVDSERTVLGEKGGQEETSDMTGSPPRKKHRADNVTTNQSSYNTVLETPAADIATGIQGNLSPAVASAGDLIGCQEAVASAGDLIGCQEEKPHTPFTLNTQCTETPWLVPGSTCATKLYPTPAIDSNCRTILETPFIGTDMVAVVGETPFIRADMVAVVGETPFIRADMVAVVGETPFVRADMVAVVGETPFIGTDMVAVVGETPFIRADMVAVVGETPFVRADMVAVVGETPFIRADMVAVVGETPFIRADMVAVVGETPFVRADMVAVVGETPLVRAPPEAMEEEEILAKESQYSDTSSSIDSHREPFPTIEETQMPIGGSEVLVCNEAMNAHSSSSSSGGDPQSVEPDSSHHAVSNHHTISPGQTQCVAETQFTKAASPEDKHTNTEWNEHTYQSKANEVDADASPAITREIVHTTTTPHCSKEDLNTTASIVSYPDGKIREVRSGYETTSTTPDLEDVLKESPTTIRESPDQIPVTRSPPPSVARFKFLSPPNSLASQSLLNHSISSSIPLQNTGSGIPERTVIPDTLGALRCHSMNEHGSIPSSQKSPVYPSTDTMLPGLYSCGIHRATAIPGSQQSINSAHSHETKSLPMNETTINSAHCQMEPPMNETTPVISSSGMLDNCLRVIPDSLLFHGTEHSPLPGSVAIDSQAKGTPDFHGTEHSPLPGSVAIDSQAKGTPDFHGTEHSPLPGSVAIDSQPLITLRNPEELLSECSYTQWDIKCSMFTQELTTQVRCLLLS